MGVKSLAAKLVMLGESIPEVNQLHHGSLVQAFLPAFPV